MTDGLYVGVGSRALLFSAALGAIAIPGGASAATGTVRQLEAHVHGVAQLGFVVDGATLVAELETPMANLVGFEHAPSTADERAAYQDALSWLRQADNVFDLGRAGCTAGPVDIAAPDFAVQDDHDHDHDHDDGDHDHGEAGHTHADIRVEYSFTCETPDRLNAIPVLLFNRFPGFERIDTILVGNGSHAAALTPDNPTLDLRR